MKKSVRSGRLFDTLLIILIIVVIAGAGFAFLRGEADEPASPRPVQTIVVPDEVTSTEDLDTAAKSIEQLDIDASMHDVESLEAELEKATH